MAVRAWLEGDLRLAIRLLQWANPNSSQNKKHFDQDETGYKAA